MDRTTYGLDIEKNVMQLHWVEAETGEIGRKKLARGKLAEYFAQLLPVRVVMEACGSAHLSASLGLVPAHSGTCSTAQAAAA
jgi:transposase